MKKFERGSTRIFTYISIVIFGLLFYHSLSITGENSGEWWDEHVFFRNESIVWSLICIALFLCGFVFIGIIYDRFLCRWKRNFFLIAALVVSYAFSVYWIYANPVAPEGDQLMVSQYANAFNMGDFRGFNKGQYIARYPQQLGLVTFLRVFYTIFGESNYQAYYHFSALMIPLIVLSGCMIVRHITGRNGKAELFYLILAVCCVPMYPYVGFFYGEIPSTALAIVSAWLFLSLMEKFSYPKLITMGVCLGVAVQFRKNVLVMVIAFVIVAVVRWIQNRSKENLLMLLSVVGGVLLLQGALRLVYYDKYVEDAEAVPALSFIVMGLNDDYGYSGWYNSYSLHTFAAYDDSTEAMMPQMKADLQTYFNLYKSDTSYAVDFFTRKMNAQWNTPMYQCMTMNKNTVGEQAKLVQTLRYRARTGLLIERVMKVYQMAMYASILYLLISKRKEWESVGKYLLLIASLGGFFFSMLWEAKTRYVFPYLLIMIPYFAVGLEALISQAKARIGCKEV